MGMMYLVFHHSYYYLISVIVFSLLILLVCQEGRSSGLPLSTDSRWIVDMTGQRVKLACVNWVTHLEPVVAEGLSKQPMDEISKKIKGNGFNCVRLTWPLYLATNNTLASISVKDSFLIFNLSESIAGLQANNPAILNLSLINAFQAVVGSLASNKVMVILDNHLSKPGWCCSSSDGNGFFGDLYFDPNLWIQGLKTMATLFKGNPYVVGMSLRNELRGPTQNSPDWYRYMQKGAETVHKANRNLLVILSGLSYDRDLSFLRDKPISLSFAGKLVFEMHWYGFSDGQAWKDGNANEVCGRVMNDNMRMSGFLLDQGYPLFVSEFGFDLRGTNVNDNRYFNCFMAWATESDIDWAHWTMVGSYYLRQGVLGLNEYYAWLDWNWCQVRNASFLDRISVIQSPLRGPGIGSSRGRLHKIIFHPLTGLCIVRKSLMEPLKLGTCSESDNWEYTNQKTLTMKGTYFCLQAQGVDSPVRTTVICPGTGTTWDPISDSKLHLAATVGCNSTVCLDVDSENNIITSNCKCLSGDNTCDPATQWFKLVDSANTLGNNLIPDSAKISPFLGTYEQ